MKKINEETLQKNESNVKRFKTTKAIDLINRVKKEPEPTILWNGIIRGSKGLIAGVSKTGKTTLAENIAISIAVGRREFFGHTMSGIPEKVLFINLEESFRIRSRRNAKQISTLTDREVDLFSENYLSTPEDFPEFITSDEDWVILSNYIRDSEADIVFIDSLSHMFKGQIETSEPAINFVKNFRKHVTILKKTVIVVHHNTKGNDKPIEQDSIAGSRIIAQEFEYAIGLGNIPTGNGGNYLCMLFNKFIEKDNTIAYMYKINKYNWVEYLGTENKYKLYTDSKPDYRINTKNKDLILNHINGKYSQYSQPTSTGELKNLFVENDTRTMSKDTLHKSLDKLISEGEILSTKHGVYQTKMKENDGE